MRKVSTCNDWLLGEDFYQKVFRYVESFIETFHDVSMSHFKTRMKSNVTHSNKKTLSENGTNWKMKRLIITVFLRFLRHGYV